MGMGHAGGEGYRFVPLAPEDVRDLLTARTGRYESEHDHLVAARREEAADGRTLDPFVLLDVSDVPLLVPEGG